MDTPREEVIIRASESSDKDYLVKWLNDPIVLKWFPMDNLREIEDSVRVWLGYCDKGASLTAVVKGQPCAMAVLYLAQYEKMKHQSLFAIIVDPDYRNLGIGTKLFEALKKEAKAKFGIELLHLEVYEGNPALKLYQRLGFTEYGKHPEFLKEGPHQYRTKILMEQWI